MTGLAPDERIFFVHVMKTGGATFRRRIEGNLGVEHVYPRGDLDHDPLKANLSVSYVLNLPEERVRDIRAYTGHFPFMVTQALKGPFVILTVLRDPVERTISYLKHCRRYQARHHGLPLEAIYEDPQSSPLIANHQAKVFSLSTADRPGSIRKVVEVDEERLKRACENLEMVDILGLHEHYDQFVADAIRYFGWTGSAPTDVHVSRPKEIADSFRRRIADDLQTDREFYDFARELYHRRRA